MGTDDARGKFDYLKREIPFSAIVQLVQGLIRQFCSESEKRIALWKEKISRVAGPYGRVLVDMIPEFELIIGKQPAMHEATAVELQNLFNNLFLSFIRTVADYEHPLVFFLDDLQWADPASLRLLQSILLNAEIKSMLIIGAYRDSGAAEAGPLAPVMDQMKKAGAPYQMIHLSCLGIDGIIFAGGLQVAP